MNFCRLRRNSSCSGENSTMSSLHAADAEGAWLERAPFGLAADRDAQRQHGAGVAWINQAVIPQPRGCIERGRFLCHAGGDGLFHGVKFAAINVSALALELLLGDDRHDL